MPSSGKLAFKVGVFVALALVVGFVVLASMGETTKWFQPHVTYHAAFGNVGGLNVGAPVRLGGREVGDVTRIEFAPIGTSPEAALIVTFRVRATYANRIREDSIAHISSLGLLGDKLVEVDVGTIAAPAVAPGGWVRGETPADAAQLLTVATDTATKARDILSRVDDMVAKGVELGDLKSLVGSLRRIADRIETGPGGLHEVIYGDHVTRALDSFADATASVARVAQALNLTEPAPDVLVNASKALASVANLASAIDPAGVNRSAANLARASDDAAAIMADVRAGRGSLGGFLEDPTIYEETKRLIVNIERNSILKTLVRFAIRRRDATEIEDANPDAVVIHPRPGPRARGEAKASAPRNE